MSLLSEDQHVKVDKVFEPVERGGVRDEDVQSLDDQSGEDQAGEEQSGNGDIQLDLNPQGDAEVDEVGPLVLGENQVVGDLISDCNDWTQIIEGIIWKLRFVGKNIL